MSGICYYACRQGHRNYVEILRDMPVNYYNACLGETTCMQHAKQHVCGETTLLFVPRSLERYCERYSGFARLIDFEIFTLNRP